MAQNHPDFESRYARAMEFVTPKLIAKVRNLHLVPLWVEGQERFWIKHEAQDGHEYLAVEAATAQKTPAFDHDKLAASLARLGFEGLNAKALPLQDVQPRGEAFSFTAPDGRRFISQADGECREVEPLARGRVPSPDGQRSAFVRNFNVHIADDAGERQVTEDGVEDFSYGVAGMIDIEVVPRRRSNRAKESEALVWSPDGRYLMAVKTDFREVPLRPFVTEHFASDQNFSHANMGRHLVTADKRRLERRIAIIDTETGACVFADLPSQDFQNFAVMHFARGIVWWSPGKVYIESETIDSRCFGIYEIDLNSGSARKIIEEREEFFYDFNPSDYEAPNFHVTADGAELIWYSQRTGFGHLYLYDIESGQLKNAITHGDWVVFNLVRVDERARRIYFTAGGVDAVDNPYYAKLYSIGFDGGGMKTLTPEPADHLYLRSVVLPVVSPSQISPSGRYIVDVASTNDLPPVMVLRTQDGEMIGEVARADASDLLAMGWTPPEPFVVKAADGASDLYGVMYKPTDFDPGKRYPVIDHTYPGPQGSYSPRSFLIGSHIAVNSQALAELGFIVINVDGRGTSHRGKKFRYAFAGQEDAFGAADQKTAIENLARDRSYIDLDQVGIKGASFGGYGSTRAFLLFPDFFKVNVSHVGPHDYRFLGMSLSNERFFMNDDDPAKVEAYYELISNTRLVDRIKGKLLLIWGEIDENVPLNNAFIMLQALLDAGAEFDSLIVPNQPHGIQHPAVLKKEFKYFYENLKPGG